MSKELDSQRVNEEQVRDYRGYVLPLYTADWFIDIQEWSRTRRSKVRLNRVEWSWDKDGTKVKL
jgi:hypothetical protein